jgi:hypothetical protein
MLMKPGPQSLNVRHISHHGLNHHGNGGQITVTRKENEYYAFIGHMKNMGTSIVDVTDASEPLILSQIPISQNTHSHKVRVCGNLMLVNAEQLGRSKPFEAGLRIYDISEINQPIEISFFKTGGRGVHKFWVDTKEKLAYISTELDGYLEAIFMIVDFNDPYDPFEVSRWWFPGQWTAGGEKPSWNIEKYSYRHHHPIILNDRAYLGYWDGGYILLDISDIHNPNMISHRNYTPPYGGAFHTALPIRKEISGRKWLVVFQESLAPYNLEGKKLMWMIDITYETNPVAVSTFQVPTAGFNLDLDRFGPHQPYEDLNLKNNNIYASWFGGGLRIINVSNPYQPKEIGYYLPQTPKNQSMIQTNDVFVDDRDMIYIIDRINGGLDILEMTSQT